MVAALYVETGGCYFGLPNVDPWDIERDARRYAGPYPVVARRTEGPMTDTFKHMHEQVDKARADGTFSSAPLPSSAATTTPLLPCPFCGGKPIWQEAEGGQATNFEPVYRVNCSECYRIDMPWWGDKIDCIKQWNARSDAPAQSAAKCLNDLDQIAFELEEWIRQPDWAEDFSLEDTVNWINARPLQIVSKLRALAAQPPAAQVETNELLNFPAGATGVGLGGVSQREQNPSASSSDGTGGNQPETRTGPHRASGETNSGATGDSELSRSARLPSDTQCSAGNDGDVRKALTSLSYWCTDERSKIGNVDGYDYRSGEEYGVRKVEVEIERRLAALPIIEPQTLWQTIETAPKDGTRIDVWFQLNPDHGARWANVRWSPEHQVWSGGPPSQKGGWTATHWMCPPSPLSRPHQPSQGEG